MRKNFTLAILAVLCLAWRAPAGEAAFTKKPTASKAGDKVKISFAVSVPVDVEVSVLDSKGETVRYLGGGLLGDNPPEPFGKGLSQEIEWDGLNDDGKKASGGPFKVSVGLGLAAEFDKLIGWSGQQIEDVRGMACGPDGTLYLFYGGQLYAHRRTTIVSAFDREGNYLRQVMPGPGGLPAEKREGWPHIKLEDGREVPVVWHMLSRAVNPAAQFTDRLFPAITSDGRLVVLHNTDAGFAGVSEPDLHDGRRLLIMNTDATVPGNYLGPVVAAESVGGQGWTAVSPDGKHAYVSGLGGGKAGALEHVVYRAELDGGGKAEVFIGKPGTAAKGAEGLNDPRGVATDKEGNVYVADCGNDRVAVFDAKGKFLKAISVKKPWQVKVSRKTGAVYVVAEDGAKLVKFGSLADPAEKASMPTKAKANTKTPNSTLIALDDSAEPHVVWLVSRFWHNGTLNKLVDKGISFEDLGDAISEKRKKGSAINFTGCVAVAGDRLVSRDKDFGYNWNIKPLFFDAGTGAPEGVFSLKKANEVVGGKDGRFYVIGSGYKKPFPIDRFDPDGNPVPFAEGEGGSIKDRWHGHTRTAGMFTTRKGEVYVPGGDSYRALNAATVRRFDANGKLVDKQVVATQLAYLGGIAVDSRGNVYLGAQVVEKDKPIPDWFAGRLPENTAHGYPGTSYRQYGAVIKFAPTGGAIEPDPGGKHFGTLQAGKGKCGPVSLKNAEWLRRGGLVPVRGGNEGVHCFCETSRFDIDANDRLFVPDIHRFCVRVLDAAGNEIALLGAYGNMDNRGPESDHPQPAIAYGWPLATQVHGGRLYVADVTNRRIAVAKLKCSLVETCPVK